jgi:hypothetical protein
MTVVLQTQSSEFVIATNEGKEEEDTLKQENGT